MLYRFTRIQPGCALGVVDRRLPLDARGGWKPPFHREAVSFIKEEVWATFGRGTEPKARSLERDITGDSDS